MNEPIYIQHSRGDWYWYEQDKYGSLRGPFAQEQAAKEDYEKMKELIQHQLVGREQKLVEAMDRVAAFMGVLAFIKSGDMKASDRAVEELWLATQELGEASYGVREANRRAKG